MALGEEVGDGAPLRSCCLLVRINHDLVGFHPGWRLPLRIIFIQDISRFSFEILPFLLG